MNKRILITGTNRGIGLALVKEWLAHDAHVVATARAPEGASELKRLAKAHPKRLLVLPMDVGCETSIQDCFQKVEKSLGGLDVLINNAAVFPEEGDESFEELSLDCFSQAFETNVVGVARVSKAFLPLLRKSDKPRIINISSGAGSISQKEDNRYYAYSTSKAALNMLTRAMAAEFKSEGIIVIPISPGWVKTEMGGPNAQITTEESARSLVKTIASLEMVDAGQFLGRDGSRVGYAW